MTDSLENFDPEVVGAVRNFLSKGAQFQRDFNALCMRPELIPQEEKTIALPTAADILRLEMPEPVWVVNEYISAGTTILASRPKLGKSWLAMQIARAVSTGGKVFDQSIKRGRVLYLALEDSRRRLKTRMIKQGWRADDSDLVTLLTFEEFSNSIGFLNQGGAARLYAMIQEKGFQFVVVDTLSRAFTGIKDINNSQDVTEALAPIHDLGNTLQIGILIVDHQKKESWNQDPVDDVAGSTAKSAIADSIFGLYTEHGKPGAILKGRGRDIEPIEKRLIFDGLTGAWQLAGDARELEITEKMNQVIEFLKGNGPSKVTSIAAGLNITTDRPNLYTRLAAMVDKGLITFETIEGTRVYRVKAS